MATATRTLLFTDLADYTGRVSRSDREGLRRILSEHEATVRPLVEKNAGQIVKNIGDSFLCAFGSATDALHAALDIFVECDTGDGPALRVALNTGDIEELDGDVFGSAVNVAARILDLTPAGECWFGEGTRVCMNETEVPWELVGRFALKGIPEEHACFRLVPTHRTWLPGRIEEAVAARTLVRMRPGDRPPPLPANPLVLLEGFATGSDALKAAMASLPVLPAQSFYLAAYTLTSGDRQDWLRSGHGLVIGTPQSISAAIDGVLSVNDTHSADDLAVDSEATMMITRPRRAEVELVVCGLALPAVPFSEIVESYSYDLLDDGRWVSRSSRALLRIEVTSEGVGVIALQGEIAVDGAIVPPGDWRPLAKAATLSTPAGTFEFLRPGRYAGIVLHDTDMRLPLGRGQRAQLGRSPESPGLAFPNRPGQENIQWCSGGRADKARQNGFTLDRVLAGRQQAALELSDGTMRLTPLHAKSPTYVMRDGRLGQAPKPVRIAYGDFVVAGTTVVGIRRPE